MGAKKAAKTTKKAADRQAPGLPRRVPCIECGDDWYALKDAYGICECSCHHYDFLLTIDRPIPLMAFAGVLEGVGKYFPRAALTSRGDLTFAITLGEQRWPDEHTPDEHGGLGAN